MCYIIARTEDLLSKITVDFSRRGNKYSVELYHQETKDFTHKEFSKIEDALALYQRLVEAIATGCYSYEDRKSWLK